MNMRAGANGPTTAENSSIQSTINDQADASSQINDKLAEMKKRLAMLRSQKY